MRNFKEQYGPWAFVTGATSGIGAELAKQIAEKGVNLILVARREKILQEKAKELTKQYKIEVETIQADLSKPVDIQKVVDGSNGKEVGLFVPCAGMVTYGLATNLDLTKELAMIQVNVTSVFALTHHFAGEMVKRGKGGVLFVSSIGGHGPNPYWSNYAGTKAYILNLGLSMHWEMKQKGVDLTVLSPGHTITPMTDAIVPEVDMSKTPMGSMLPSEVAKIGLAALGKKPYVIPGTKNKLMIFISNRIASTRFSISSAGKLMENAFRNQL